MAAEQRRGCGFRKVHGLYLVGGMAWSQCDRLPFPLDVCPTYGHGIKVGRGMTGINPMALFGNHDKAIPTFPGERSIIKMVCKDKVRPCMVCDPTTTPAFIMLVGEKFYSTPQDFIVESLRMGISKRIAQIPRHLVLGETVVYLAHHKACIVQEEVAVTRDFGAIGEQQRLLDASGKQAMGIFGAFIPKRVEKIYWKSELKHMKKEEREALKRRGITPVGVTDNDPDHEQNIKEMEGLNEDDND